MADSEQKVDDRVEFLRGRVAGAFKHLKADRVDKGFNAPESIEAIMDFLDSKDTRVLVFGESCSGMTQLSSKNVKGKTIVFIKPEPEKLSLSSLKASVLQNDVTGHPLEHLEKIIQDVYLPLLSNPANQEGWGEVASKEILDKMHGFLANVSITVGSTKGKTCLPLPPEPASEASVDAKERIHLLEGAVITWTKQIKNVLKLDPEGLLKQGLNPTPDLEIEFWKAKAANLNAIFDQLQSSRVRRVLQYLENAKSTYCLPFARLCKEVFAARLEANDNVKYLRTLEGWFHKLNTMDEFPLLVEVFKPMMHILLLIWKNSKYYNSPSRLVVLMREICNAIINQACSFMSGKQLFQLLEEEESNEALNKLKTTLRVCGQFKATYFDYRDTANAECPSNQWRIQNNAMFMRLDAFLERVHDVLELTQTIIQFSRLARIEIGGTKGRGLTNSVQQVHGDFETAVATIKAVPYDLMDVSKKQFDDDFYQFRCTIKNLERRLASILTQAFDDTATIYGRFKLLDSFDDLLERPIIQDELERKQIALIQQYGLDLKRVQELFLTERENPPISWNLPPIAGALAWCRGLKERIVDPMAKLKQLNRTIMNREEAKEVSKIYASIMSSLDDYEHQKIEEWGADVERSSQAKLKLPLLAYQKENPQLLTVNFDPALVKLLREVKYFLLLGLEVPQSALEIYQKTETFRRQTGNLDLVVNMYNRMVSEMLPVEAPLMKTQMTKIENTLQAGIKDINWKSTAIEGFIQDCQACVKEAHDVLFQVKDNLRDIQQILDKWAAEPLLQRKPKPATPVEMAQAQKQLIAARFQDMKTGGVAIEKKLQASHAVMKVAKVHPNWRAYVDFTNSIVIMGLSKLVVKSLQYLTEQLDPERIAAANQRPLLQIKLDLVGGQVRFVPDIEEAGGTGDGSLWSIVNGWVDSFFQASTLFKRLDDAEGRYVKELVDDMYIQMLLATVNGHLADTQDKCQAFRATFDQFSRLWTEDAQSVFAAFVAEATITTASGEKLPDLAKFSAEITELKKLQTRVNDMKTPTDLGWIRISSEPIKQALATCVSKRIFTFTDYLMKHLTAKLEGLNDTVASVTAGLKEEVNEGDKAPLKRVMGFIRDVKKSMEANQDMFGPLKEAVTLLRSHGIHVEQQKIGTLPLLEFLETAPLKWEATVNATFKKKEEIFPLQTAEMEKIKEQVDAFFLSMREFRNRFRKTAPFAFTGTAEEAYGSINGFTKELKVMSTGAAELNELEELFELPISKYNETADTRSELQLLKRLWDFKELVRFSYEDWQTALWNDVNTEVLEDKNKKLMTQLKRYGDTYPIIKGWQVYRDVEKDVKNMAVSLPLVNDLHSPAMRPRHWKELARVCECKGLDPTDSKFCLEDLLKLHLHLHADDIMEIVETASKELKIERKLEAIETRWNSLNLDYVPHKDSDMMVIRPSDEVVEGLEEHQMELQTIVGMGKFVDYFRDRVTLWQKNLGTVESVLREWVSVTKAWASLESIFLASADIRAQLPDDTKRFEGIDLEFKELMKAAVETPNVVVSCAVEGREEKLKEMTKNLELCQKSLNEYLDMKKKIFPRFYFVSNVALLDMLSNSNNPLKILPYLGDCFDSLAMLKMEPPAKEGDLPNIASSMIAKDGEVVTFPKPFHIQGAVENWLNDLNKVQQETMAVILEQAIEAAVNWEHEKPRHEWLRDYPAQLVLTACLVYWTEECQAALDELESGQEDSVKKYLQLCNERLHALIQLVLGKLDPDLRAKIISLITIDVHGRDVVQSLIDGKAEGPMSFGWQQQLRFYWLSETKDVSILITDFKGLYAYEWVGNSGRLVITPLTDRCYITLTMALRLMLGGAPAGPAGTGKTETVKDLARACALACYVFNCSPQMNYQTLGNIFKGLSQTGAWGCFDEFNRISIEVLSVVATQVKQVLDAIVKYANPANREERFQSLPAGRPNAVIGYFELAADLISLIPTNGIFITMNPGYAGRTELPENIKALFRSCAMIRPDLALICENMLMSEGFKNARLLSVKFTSLYQLCSELLSPQGHYDWGLRAVKSVLRVAGGLKRADPDIEEDGVLMRALRDFNTPKMPSQDLPIFLRLIQDMFPFHHHLPTKFDDELQKLAIQAALENKLQTDNGFIHKVVQLQELLDVRHSVMLLGPAGCAKTSIWRILAASHNLGKPKKVCITEIVEPKAVPLPELYGYMTLAKEWKDGVVSIIMRGMSKNFKELGFSEHQTHKWIVFDGDIDTLWIESMNTVMDDNKTLTLVSNERIPLSRAMRLLFEISSVENASPATVSRAGMLYINDTDIGWRPFVESWMTAKIEDPSVKAQLPSLFDKFIDPLYDQMRKTYKFVTRINLMGIVSTVCRLLEAYVPTMGSYTADILEALFTQSVMWAFGGALTIDKNADHRRNFSDIFTALVGAIKIPKETKESLCFDYFLDVQKGEFVPWASKVPVFSPVPIGTGPGETMFNQLLVQTVDTVRLTHLLTQLHKNGHPVMFVGVAGTGKTAILKDYLKSLDPDHHVTDVINMNYYMDCVALQLLLEGPIDKRSGKIFGPPAGKHMTYYVDDINLPWIEEFGTQNSLSLLRQVMDHKFVFDRGDLSLRKELIDLRFISSMNPTAGSFNISTRLQRFFSTFALLMPSQSDLFTIYNSILAGHLQTFSSDVQNICANVVNGSLNLHNVVSNRFLPSATRFVYNWNMRELSNLFQNLTLAQGQYFPETKKFVRLYAHEAQRVFRDRLVNKADGEIFDEILAKNLKDTFGGDVNSYIEEPLIFTTFAAQPAPGLNAYIPLPIGKPGYDMINKTLTDKLEDYNSENTIMELVLFQQAIEHVCRITRIIFNPSGNAMLVGVGGSGKQSLSRLAAYICGYVVRQLAVTARFTVTDLKESLKDMYRLAGVKGQGLVFLMTDTQIVDDKFLVFVNDMLSAGWIKGLFEKDEMDNIFQSLRNEAKQAGIPDMRDMMMEFFISRILRNLHVVLCFSPVGESFRIRARRFPGLINCTVIDWFHAWPREALESVATRFIEDVDLTSDAVRVSVAEHMAQLQLGVTEISTTFKEMTRRANYVTPKSFLELISFYKHLLATKRSAVGKQINRLDVGLSILRKTQSDVAELQVDLEHTMVKVEEKKLKTELLLKDMGVERAVAEEQQAIAEKEAEKAGAASRNAAEIEHQAQSELAEAKPAMEAAAEAVNCLSKASLTELKNFNKPPEGVDQVTACCLMMLEAEFKNHTWDRAKKMMAKVDEFIARLKSYSAETMAEDLITRLQPFVVDPLFTQERMASKSSAAANLCAWVVNTYKYNRIYVKVKPLMDALNDAQARKAEAEEQLRQVQEKVAEVEAKLKELQDKLMEATNEKLAVEQEARACTERLALAERLVGGLASENTRWGAEVDRLKLNEVTLIGDVLLASAFVSYIGAFDFTFRKKLWEGTWLPDLVARSIPISDTVDPLTMLTNDGHTAKMLSEGLPADRISIENGSIVSACKRWPLLIDPQLQGIKWLKGREEKRTDGGLCVVLQLTQNNWLRQVTNAIQQGHSVIIENITEDIDATLDPVLSRAVYKKGRTLFLQIGGEEVEFDPKFRLYLQTKLSNPHYKPEIQAQCTLVNFIATEMGLADQLLARAVNEEKAELEQQKQALQEAFNQYKIQLLGLEDQLLERLSNAPEDILSDVPLIEGLEATKLAAREIEVAVEAGKKTEKDINKARQVYVPVATEGAMLYFMITQLNAIEHMYQYSLDSFLLYFYKSIREAPKAEDDLQRVQNLRDTLRFVIYTWVSRGLFERHKLILLGQLTFQLITRGMLSMEPEPELLRFLLTGPKKIGEANPVPWLPDTAWNSLQSLAEVEEFHKLPSDIVEAPTRFMEWFNHVTPETEKLPLDWARLDKEPLKKLVVLRCMRPDRLNIALQLFVTDSLPRGKEFVMCDATLNSAGILENTLGDSTPATPIFFILSPGADVVGDVEACAAKFGYVKGTSFHNVAMGQGQDVIAMEALELGHKQGHWVLLNNVHLMPGWLVELEKKLDQFASEGSHDRFRVLLTGEPANSIPIGILSRSIKLTNEPPSGLKANLIRAFCSFSPEFINEVEPKTRAILFGLCHFHAVLIERKKFGPIGYNIMYPFSLGDLRDSSVCLSNYMENASSKIPWEDLRYIFGQIMYGGHIVNDFDRLLTMSYLNHFLRDELLDEMELFPFVEGEKASFKSPSPTTYEAYLQHIENELVGDTPLAFGLHPNAEIGFRTDQSETTFRTLLELQPREQSGGGDVASPQKVAENMMQDILDRFGDVKYEVDDIGAGEERGPFQNVLALECEQMNRLLVEVNRSLIELGMGFAGELTMSDAMDDLMSSLYLNRVPKSWARLAWPSLRSLQSWLHNWSQRIQQLSDWAANPMEVPKVVWLSGLINPQSFLTAIAQQTAQRNSLELDKLVIQTEVTKKMAGEMEASSREGAYVSGFFLQGCRWDLSSSQLDRSKPREMYCPMPVINCKAVPSDKLDEKGVYRCPVYKTEQRGPTYVFMAQLKTKVHAARWVMSGVALLLDVVQ